MSFISDLLLVILQNLLERVDIFASKKREELLKLIKSHLLLFCQRFAGSEDHAVFEKVHVHKYRVFLF